MNISSNPYIPWDVDYLYRAVAAFRANIGSGINIGLWIFFISAGVLLCIAFIRHMAE